jgi:glycine oxidase
MKAIVVGGGIIGSAVAWRLAREGAEVTLLERGGLGREASWAAAGMIAPQAEAQARGPFFDLCMLARERFGASVEALRAESGIDPEYDEDGILYVGFDAAEGAELAERARWQRAAGGKVTEISPGEARRLEPALSSEIVCALYMPNDRRTDNRKLTRAFATAAAAKGAKLIEGVRVESIAIKSGRASGVRLHDGKELAADFVINAAGAWAGDIRGLEDDRVATFPVRGQMLCFEGLGLMAGPSVFSLRGYLVPRRDGRVIAGSTMEEAGYDTRVTLAGIAGIAAGAHRMLPAIGGAAFREAWAGLRPATRDFLPVLGVSPSAADVLYATGHFRSGILLSALTGEIIADLVFGRQPAIELEPFSPARFGKSGKVAALALVRDILFRSRIDAAARAIGVEVAYASGLDQALSRYSELKPFTVIADISDPTFPAEAIAAHVKSGGKVRLIGFASHVDLKSLGAARAAGFDLTLSRSEFTTRLAELLKP